MSILGSTTLNCAPPSQGQAAAAAAAAAEVEERSVLSQEAQMNS